VTFPFATYDGVVQAALQSLSQQRDNMDQARATITGIEDEVRASFKCQAATIFEQKMDDWLVREQTIRDLFERIYEDVRGAHAGINDAHDYAVNVGGSAFGEVYGGLS
jgi:hypothetical protein